MTSSLEYPPRSGRGKTGARGEVSRSSCIVEEEGKGVCSGSTSLGSLPSSTLSFSATFGGDIWRLAFLLSSDGDGLESADLSRLLGLGLPLGGDLAGVVSMGGRLDTG